MAAVTVEIAGVVVDVLAGSLSVGRELRGRATCEFTIRRAGSVPPAVGDPVKVSKDGTVLFGGRIDSVDRSTIGGDFVIEYRYVCADWHQVLERRLTGLRTWVNTLAGQIVRDLAADFLGGEGFVAGAGIQYGPLIEKFEVSYATVADAIAQLVELANHEFTITPEKVLRFFSPVTYTAPFQLVSAPDTNNARQLRIRVNRHRLVNRAVMRLGNYILDERSESFNSTGRHGGVPDPDPDQPTDGARKSFTVTYAIHTEPRVFLDGMAETVGIGGVETGKQWYWNSGSRAVRQDDTGTALTAAQQLEVVYVGLSEAHIEAENAASILIRAGIEGGSGKYEELISANDPLTRTQGQQLANQILAARGDLSCEASFETDGIIQPGVEGLDVGQVIGIRRSGYAADGDYLIRSLRWQDIRGREELRALVTAVKGPLTVDVAGFFKGLGGGSGLVSGSGGGPSGGRAVVVAMHFSGRLMVINDTFQPRIVMEQATMFRRLVATLREPAIGGPVGLAVYRNATLWKSFSIASGATQVTIDVSADPAFAPGELIRGDVTSVPVGAAAYPGSDCTIGLYT